MVHLVPVLIVSAAAGLFGIAAWRAGRVSTLDMSCRSASPPTPTSAGGEEDAPGPARWAARVGERRIMMAACLVLAAASIVHTRVSVYTENHAVQVPLVRVLADPGLFQGDPYRDALLRYPSFLWSAVSILSRAVPLEPLLVGLFVLERIAALAAAAALARAIAPRSILAPVCAMVLYGFSIESILAYGTIVEGYFEQTGVAVLLIVFASAAFHRDRHIAFALCLAAAFDVNGLYASYAASYFGASFLLDRERCRAWKSWTWAGGIFLFAAAPGILAGFRALGGARAADDALWLAASLARGGHHLYPLSWKRVHFVELAILMGLVVAALVLRRRCASRLFREGMVWTAGCLAWLVLAFVAAYGVRSPSLLALQPARASDVWIAWGAVALVACAAARFESSTGGADSRAALLLLGAPFLLWVPLGHLPLAGALLALAFLPRLWRFLLGHRPARRLAFGFALWAMAVSSTHLGTRLAGGERIPEALIFEPDNDVRETGAWARAMTPRDSVFLVNPGDNPGWEPFRALSDRSIYTSWEEGTAMFWDRPFVGVWAERLADFGLDVRLRWRTDPVLSLNEIYAKLDDAKVRSLAKRHRVDFWVAPIETKTALRVVFRTGRFNVLLVPH